MTKATDRTYVSKVEEQHPLMVLISELSIRVEDEEDVIGLERMKIATDNSPAMIMEWCEAVGHLSSLASKHKEADTLTMNSLGVCADMLGKLSMLTAMLRDLDYTLSEAKKE